MPPTRIWTVLFRDRELCSVFGIVDYPIVNIRLQKLDGDEPLIPQTSDVGGAEFAPVGGVPDLTDGPKHPPDRFKVRQTVQVELAATRPPHT